MRFALMAHRNRGDTGVRINQGGPLAVPKSSSTQINLHKSKEAAAPLSSRLVLEHRGVALVQEPGLRNKKLVSGLNNCGTVFQQANAPVRACVVVRRQDAELVPKLTFGDLTTVRIRYKTAESPFKEMLVVSAYLHGFQEVPSA